MPAAVDQRRVTSAPAEGDQAEPAGGDTSYHPAFDSPAGRPAPAGKVIAVIAVALLVGLLFNSSGTLHLALGMRDGPAKSIALTLIRPVNWLAHATWLDRPKLALDRAFGHSTDASGGQELLTGDASILERDRSSADGPATQTAPGPAATAPAITAPTKADPLRTLVLGDSLATFPAQQIDAASDARELVHVKELWRNGTGITTPEFYNWQSGAAQAVDEIKPEAVVMILGGNDNEPMTHDGKLIRTGGPDWETEYARRVAVVMQSMIDHGVQRVYWSGPPLARSDGWNSSYRRVNAAIARAAAAIPGARYVDLYQGTSDNGRYSDYMVIDGNRVKARQSDGIHWTYDGAKQVAELVQEAMQKDYGDLF